MRILAQFISGIALAATLVAPVVFLIGLTPPERTNQILLVATIAWFIATPLWMGRELNDTAIGQ